MIYIFGDVHNNFQLLISKIKSLPPKSNIIVCGDFGYYPNIYEAQQLDLFKSISDINYSIYFCPGNHEDWDSLDSLTKSPEVYHINYNVFYCPFGSTLTLDGINILFCGGAESPDYKFRTPGYDWFPQEGISIAEMNNLPLDYIPDLVVSHTCPTVCFYHLGMSLYYDHSSSKYLDFVLSHYHPLLWAFGHLHVSGCFRNGPTKFIALDRMLDKDNYILLEDYLDVS